IVVKRPHSPHIFVVEEGRVRVLVRFKRIIAPDFGCVADPSLESKDSIYDSRRISVCLKISATEAARNFSDLVNRVYCKGETFVLERGGEPVCKISPVKPAKFTGADFVELLSHLPRPDSEYFDLLEELNRGQQPLEPE